MTIEPSDNLERLKAQLKKDSLAEKLVSASIRAGANDPAKALRQVVLDRIEELKRAL